MLTDFTGCNVFSATMANDRAHLGEKVTAWLQAHPALEVVDVVVTQSSDEAFHCVTITVFWRDAQLSILDEVYKAEASCGARQTPASWVAEPEVGGVARRSLRR